MGDAGGYELYGFVADFYDHFPPYRDRADIDFYVSMARKAEGRVLELACGTGRVLIPTARAGIEIVGVDLSPYMLQVCSERLLAEPADVRKRVTLLQQDIRAFQLEGKFRLVTMPFRPFQHLESTKDQIDCLGCIRRHIEESGRLVFDLFNPSVHSLATEEGEREIEEGGEFDLPDGRKVRRWHRFVAKDLFHQVNHVEMIYDVRHPDGREERLVHSFPMRYLFRYEVEHLPARCGFALENLYADFQGNPYGSRYPGDLVIVARPA